MTTLRGTGTIKGLIFKDCACRARLTDPGGAVGDSPNSQYAHPPGSGGHKLGEPRFALARARDALAAERRRLPSSARARHVFGVGLPRPLAQHPGV